MAKIMIAGGTPGSLINFRSDLIKEWINRGHEVVATSAPASQDLEKRLKEFKISFVPLPLVRDVIDPLKDFKLLVKLFSVIKQEKPDLIFAYMVKPVIYTSLLSRLFPGIKMYSLITGIGHAFTGESVRHNVLQGILKRLYKLALQKNELVIFQNPDDPLLFKKLGIITRDQKTLVVNGSGVNLEYFQFAVPRKSKDITFIMVGRIIKSKGVYEFVKAAKIVKANYKEANFKLLGFLAGKLEGISLEEVKRFEADNIIQYLGRTDDVRPYLADSSVFVLPSYYREGTPRSILEAMAVGRPVITTDAPGCRETVQEGINGFLVPIKDSAALARAMENFIRNPDLIEIMGEESRRIAEEKYDVHQVNREILTAMGLF